MKSLSYIVGEMSTTHLIRSVVEVYEEVSSMKMTKIRDEIVRSRDFLDRLSDLSSEIGGDLSSVEDGKKGDAAVYISTEKGMYGDLPEKVFFTFLQFVDGKNVTPIIVGKFGELLAKKHKPSLKYEFFDVSGIDDINNVLPTISNRLLEYKKVSVFYGKFRNIANQDPAVNSLSTEVLKINKKNEQLIKSKLKFLYEPSVDDVSKKFANEIKASILEGMMMENELAKTASRLMHLDSSYEKIQDKIKYLRILKNRESKRVEDKKQQERVKRLWI